MTDTAFGAFLPELVDIRHRLHQMPETGFEERQTSAFVAGLLRRLEAPFLEPLEQRLVVTHRVVRAAPALLLGGAAQRPAGGRLRDLAFARRQRGRGR